MVGRRGSVPSTPGTPSPNTTPGQVWNEIKDVQSGGASAWHICDSSVSSSPNHQRTSTSRRPSTSIPPAIVTEYADTSSADAIDDFADSLAREKKNTKHKLRLAIQNSNSAFGDFKGALVSATPFEMACKGAGRTISEFIGDDVVCHLVDGARYLSLKECGPTEMMQTPQFSSGEINTVVESIAVYQRTNKTPSSADNRSVSNKFRSKLNVLKSLSALRSGSK